MSPGTRTLRPARTRGRCSSAGPSDTPSGHQLGQDGPLLPCPPTVSGRLAEGPGLTSMASLVDHEHIGADANYPTDITL